MHREAFEWSSNPVSCYGYFQQSLIQDKTKQNKTIKTNKKKTLKHITIIFGCLVQVLHICSFNSELHKLLYQ